MLVVVVAVAASTGRRSSGVASYKVLFYIGGHSTTLKHGLRNCVEHIVAELLVIQFTITKT